MVARVILALALLTPAGCKERVAASDTSAAGPAQRKVIGEGAAYVPDSRQSAVIAAELRTSLAKRREFAWGVVRKVLKPVPLSAAAQQTAGGTALPKVPTWLTWYTADEAQKIFTLFYTELKRLTAAGTCTATPVACDRTKLAKEAITTYSEQKDAFGDVQDYYERLVEHLTEGGDEAEALAAGLGKGEIGISVTLFDPSTVRHYLENFDEAIKCYGAHAGSGATPPPLQIATLTEDVFGACFKKPFPTDSVAVKARWQRIPAGGKLRSYATSGEALLRDFATTKGDWRSAEGVDAVAESIYRVRVISASTRHEYALTGLHLTTKEVPEWVWVSLWWSHEPDGDFGADRPDDLAETEPAWGGYKMCMTSTFKEEDPLFARRELADGKLGDVMAPLLAVYGQNGGHTWCSNPYIEFGAHEIRSNCVGCHQSAAPGERFLRHPTTGSRHNVLDKRANNFMADFLWSFGQPPDEMAAKIGDIRRDLGGTP